jgi:hypothetical protein
MRDFFQFASMTEKSLWQTYTNSIKEQSRDILLWNKFDNVIVDTLNVASVVTWFTSGGYTYIALS